MIAGVIRRTMKFRPACEYLSLNVVASCHTIGFKILCGFQQVVELHAFVASDAGHRSCPGKIAVGEFLDFGSEDPIIELLTTRLQR